MKKSFFVVWSVVLLCCIGICKPAKSQDESDENAIIHFDNGVGFDSPDKKLSMNIRFRIQNRVGLTTKSDDDFTIADIEAVVKRIRLRFDGFVLSKNLTYTFQLGFSRYDIDWDKTKFPNVLRDALVYYRFNKNFYMGFGQGKLPGNRQRVISSGQQQFIDRSSANNTFNIDRDLALLHIILMLLVVQH